MDSNGSIYTNEGKLDSGKNEIWGGKTPFAITDIREDFLYGFSAVNGHYGNTIYRVLKTGIDLMPKTVMGVK
ncbi:hypothetical protein [Planococcus faecalis]|uniref:hypothetical protein n=1 Tax=Planococcus faecalis TaxID=1598147 RepID=UPI0008D9CDCA|nr:hypothetical protein [Planococcus faecalis]OHX55281.1 hypothetical protein BB777_04375 [Planococcus faecalis]